MEIKKAIKIGQYVGIVIVLLYGIVFFIPKTFFKEKIDKPWIEEFEDVLKEDLVKVIIYCELNKKELDYKIIITDKKIIEELKKASTFDYGTKFYSGGYRQRYSILLEFKDGRKYMYGFNKTFSARGDYCRKSIEYKGKLYINPYNDCGQISIYSNPSLTETDLINDPYPNAVVSGYNLKLIGFIEKYADSVPFDGKTKVPFFNRFELEEMRKQIQK